MPTEHAPGCVLDPVHWLRHAIAAAGRLIKPEGDPEIDHVDRMAAESLADTLAVFAETADWATTTLRDVAQHATLMDNDFFHGMCTCGATA
jgi:hypothetical protein